MTTRILVVSKNVPWPANSGEKQRTLGVVRALATQGEVTLVGFAGPYDDTSLAGQDNVRVRAVPQPESVGPAALLTRALRHRSITAGRWRDERLAGLIAEEIALGVDVIVIGHVQLAGYLPRDLRTATVSVLDMHNVESLLTRRLAKSTRSWKRLPIAVEAVALRLLERRLAPRFDLVSVVSETDRSALAEVVKLQRVVVVPNAVVAPRRVLTDAPGPTACFVGLLSWAPNADAAVSFARRVWPAVRAEVPDAHLLLVGRDPTPEVRALANDGVTVTGTVDDVLPWYERSRVALAPLLAGGGSRLKILEALAWRRPVVATRIGAEGLEDLIGRGVVVADDDESFCAELVSLLRDPGRCDELGAQGAAAVRDDHSWEAATTDLLRHLGILTHAG